MHSDEGEDAGVLNSVIYTVSIPYSIIIIIIIINRFVQCHKVVTSDTIR